MSGQRVILSGPSQRRLAQEMIERAPVNAVVNIREANRTAAQNDKLWAMLSDVSRARPEGRVMTTDMWKAAFMHSLGHEIIWQPGLDGGTPFPAGYRSSRLTVAQMCDLIEFIYEYGARHGVIWTAP